MRQDIHVHLDLSVPARTLIFLMAAALLVIVTPELGSENVTLSTYYPAPSGVYNKMITTNTTFLATSGGRVGIGTTVPAAALDVAGGLLRVAGAAGANVADQGAYLGWNALGGGGTGETDFVNNQGSGSGGFAFFNYNSAATDFQVPLLIAGSGAVSIGNSNPTGTNDWGSKTPNVGLYLTGQNNTPGQTNYGYLYIDNAQTGCGTDITQVIACKPDQPLDPLTGTPPADAGSCTCSGYVTWTPGVYIEGWSFNNRGSPPNIRFKNGDVGTIVQGFNTSQDSMAGQNWANLQSVPDGGGMVWCCNK
jgi:hypothetical protein